MKTYWKSVLVAAAAVVVGSSVRADETKAAPEERRERGRETRMAQLEEALNLSAEQKAKIEAIWKKAEGEVAEVRDKGTLRKRKQLRELREIKQETRAEVRAVLTPPQQKIFDTMPRERGGAKAMR